MKVPKFEIEYEYNFNVIGISSSSKEFKLAWAINNSLKINLVKNEDIEYQFLKHSRFMISNFLFESEYSNFRLLKNKAVEYENIPKPFLLHECKEFDYLFRLEGEFDTEYLKQIELKIKELSIVQHVKMLDIQNISSKENLLF